LAHVISIQSQAESYKTMWDSNHKSSYW